MLTKEEFRLIKITRLVPIFVLIISILAILFITEKNDQSFENNLKEIEENSVSKIKEQIKNEVFRVHDYINEERKQTVSKIKNNIKGRTNEAYSIIASIYSKNQGKTQLEIKRMVINALRDIRFNDGRGYFFLYKTDGTVLMLPTLTHLEKTNQWDVQDVKGAYIIRQVSNIATNKGEGFLTWWYNKPTENNVNKSFEKIGYVKHFKPYDWFVGTGEYIDDFESDLKVRLLSHINNISLNNNGYVFVIGNQGNYMSDYLDEYDGIDVINSPNAHAVLVRESITKVAQSGEGFISYTSIIQPNILISEKKMSFVKSYADWGWSIGTGIYLNELNETIKLRQKELVEKNKHKRYQIIFIGLLICIPVFILSLLLSNQIRSRFEEYKNKVEIKSNELRSLNKDLEKTVELRTKKLEDTIIDLKSTQDKLIETEKMASMIGLVTGVAHEMNTPFGVVITALSQTEENISKFINLLKEQQLTKNNLANFESVLEISYELINRNMQKAVNLIDSFKSLSPQLQMEDIRTFSINDPIQHVLLENKELLHNAHIKILLNIHEDTQITNYFHMISGALHQLIQNSIIHAFDDNDNNKIFISIDRYENFITIEYKDNGQGIPFEYKEKIFEPFFTTKRNTNCTGLGLSILYNRVVHQLKGEIKYDLVKNQGVKVDIKFPL